MDVIKQLEVLLEKSKNSYAVNAIPVQLTSLDYEINEIIDYSLSISHAEQVCIRESITVDMAWLLLCFGIRMATYALRFSSQRYFSNGLFAISMTVGVLDSREALVVLPLYCDVQKKKNLYFEEMFNLNNEFATLLKDFSNRDAKDKSLECMGYSLEIDENNTPTYQRTW
jgi:hypothetical protein